MENPLRRIRAVADYQFGKGTGACLFPDDVKVVFSNRTGRIRHVYLDGKRIVTMRPTDGLFALSIEGAERMMKSAPSPECLVMVQSDVSQFIAEGGDVFAAHVVKADPEIRTRDEVIVVDDCGRILAVGRAVLSGGEMKAFNRGVAVKVRHGCLEEG